MGVDPVSEDYISISTYQFAHNNPVWKIEIEGLEGAVTSGQDIINQEPNVFEKGMAWVSDYLWQTAETITGGPSYSTVIDPGQALKMPDVATAEGDNATNTAKAFITDPVGTTFGIIEDTVQSVRDLGSGDAKKTANSVIALAPFLIAPEASVERPMTKLEARAAKLSEKPRPGKALTKAGKEVTVELNKAKNGGKTVCETCGKQTVPAKKDTRGVSTPKNRTEIDHVKKRRVGGSGTPDNTRVRCRGCNNADR